MERPLLYCSLSTHNIIRIILAWRHYYSAVGTAVLYIILLLLYHSQETLFRVLCTGGNVTYGREKFLKCYWNNI